MSDATTAMRTVNARTMHYRDSDAYRHAIVQPPARMTPSQKWLTDTPMSAVELHELYEDAQADIYYTLRGWRDVVRGLPRQTRTQPYRYFPRDICAKLYGQEFTSRRFGAEVSS